MKKIEIIAGGEIIRIQYQESLTGQFFIEMKGKTYEFPIEIIKQFSKIMYEDNVKTKLHKFIDNINL